MAGNVLMSISQDERERAVFRSRRMYQTDLESNLATAEDRGERRGIETVAKNMLLEGESIDKIARFTGLNEYEITTLKNRLLN